MSEMASRNVPAAIEERIASTVHLMVDVAGQLGSSLAAVEHNTREIFWWTSWVTCALLGLFLVHLLTKVYDQLSVLNAYQGLFEQMWREDREIDERVRSEERDERQMQELRARAQQRARGKDPQGQARAETQIEDYINGVLDAVGPIPSEGTQEYEDFLEELRYAARNRGQPQEEY
ncbi:hypothetical protein F4802DRAFT_355472 [Xylaria palmicola]|nr:hypothetical protein F4802DRAFT_355472 [Xylaria palmicola]